MEWQCSTIQFDFNLPEKFKMYYIGEDGQKHVPLMIHRALFGSIERFTAMLLEHYQGNFPFWISPVQVKIIPIAKSHFDYSDSINKKLLKDGIRVSMDLSSDHFSVKIRNAEKDRIPVIIIIGDKEKDNNFVTVRERMNKKQTLLNSDELKTFLKELTDEGKAEYLGL